MDRDSCGGDGRLVAAAFVAAAVVTAFDGVGLDGLELEPRSDALVKLGPFVGREAPHAPAVMTVTSAIATPTTRRRGSVDEERTA